MAVVTFPIVQLFSKYGASTPTDRQVIYNAVSIISMPYCSGVYGTMNFV